MAPTEPLPDTWSTRDLPVLRVAAAMLDEDPGRPLSAKVIAERTPDLDESDIVRAVVALTPTYLESDPIGAWGGGTVAVFVTSLTERGRRVVGLWPSGDTPEALIEALQQAAQATADPAEQSRIRQAAGALMSLSRDVLVDITASVIAHQTGLN